MKKIFHRRFLCVPLILTLLFSGCTVGNKEVVVTFNMGSKDVFTVGDRTCNLSEAKVYLCNYKNLYGTGYGIDLWEHASVSDDLESYVKEITVSQLTRIYCMDALAADKGITLSEAEQSQAAEAATAYESSLSDAERTYMDVSVESLTQMYQNYALANKLYTSLTGSVNDEVSEDEARVLDIIQVYVSDSAKADTVAEKIASGSDFAAVAAEYTERTQVEFTVARGELPQAVEEAAYALDNDDISDKIETDDGFYFIKCVSKNVEELTEQNKLVIAKNREKAMFDDVYDAFVAQLDSNMNEKLWNSVSVAETSEITTDSFFAVYDEYFE